MPCQHAIGRCVSSVLNYTEGTVASGNIVCARPTGQEVNSCAYKPEFHFTDKFKFQLHLTRKYG